MTGTVKDLHGITHAVRWSPNEGFAGCTTCNVRFWTVRLGTPSLLSLGRDQRMAETGASVDCMSCLADSTYDEACNDGSPPTSETA